MVESTAGVELGHVAAVLLTLPGMAAGLSVPVAFVIAMGFVLSSTAVIMQMLDERGELSAPQGQRAVSILLPYIKPRREGRALNEEAAEALEDEDEPQKTGA
jgi:hypothetical protein